MVKSKLDKKCRKILLLLCVLLLFSLFPPFPVAHNYLLFFPCSPIGEVFRARLRQFPSLVTCCTIDWFSAWPEEALQAVATTFLNELPELEASPKAMRGLVRMLCVCVCVCL